MREQGYFSKLWADAGRGESKIETYMMYLQKSRESMSEIEELVFDVDYLTGLLNLKEEPKEVHFSEL